MAQEKGGRSVKNKEFAQLLFEIADVLEMQGVDWKPNAFRKAARGIESFDDLEKLYMSKGRKGLQEIDGVGEGISKHLEEFLVKGRVAEFEKVRASVPQGLLQMMRIPGLGPKKVMRLFKEEKIKGVEELEEFIKSGRLQELEGFGKKSAEDILRGIELVKNGTDRKLLGEALSVARELCVQVEAIPGVKKAEVAGSLRRRKETIGDIDILVISDNPEKVMAAFVKFPQVQTVLGKGPTKVSVLLTNRTQADVRVLSEKEFGAGLQYFTGSKDHNVELRRLAISKGYKLSEYGLFKGGKFVAGRTEKDVYEKLGLKWIPPEMREAQGEIENSHSLPKIIEYGELKGDLHMHTKWSDGQASIEQMVLAAQKFGYEYIATTDHSKSERIANGMDEKKLADYIKAVRKAQEKVSIKLFAGAEVSILKDGSFDYADKDLKKLDIVVASVHSRFKQSKEEMTKRVLKALDNPYVRILGHPTGRLINVRNPFEIDLDAVFAKAEKNNIALEINSNPPRLDLKDSHIRQAIEKGCLLSIDTDAHAPKQLEFMEYGIAQARRGWATSKNIVNSWPLKEFEKWLRR